MGRIEHTLLDEGRAASPTDLRPTPATPLSTPPYHIKLQMFLFATKGRNPARGVWGLRPYERSRCAEHGRMGCARPTGGRHGLTTRGPAQRGEGAKRRAAPKEREKRGPVDQETTPLARR